MIKAFAIAQRFAFLALVVSSLTAGSAHAFVDCACRCFIEESGRTCLNVWVNELSCNNPIGQACPCGFGSFTTWGQIVFCEEIPEDPSAVGDPAIYETLVGSDEVLYTQAQ